MAERDDKSIQKLIQKWQTKGLKLNDDESLIQFLYVYDFAVTKVYASLTKNGSNRNQPFRLRDTQKVTIITLLMSTSTLAQVSTGEGKSLIVAGVAIAHALSGKKIDVIISNDVLALRDSNLSVADGGLRDIYEYFKVEVANNCSEAEDDRVKAYDSAVVYGELANFQRDYLLDSFHGRNIRGDRTFDLVIIDEVDCMLLDRGNNTLYLSHDIPGMEMLESLYVFIWEKICNSSDGLEKIKSDVLYDLYGAITKEDLEAIHAPLADKPSGKNELWDYLIEAKIIDPQGRLLVDKLGIIAENINYIENPDFNPKLIFFFRKVIERKRRIQIPSHLLSFVDRHLDTWLENALLAQYLKPDVDYVIDQDRTDTSPDLNPQVIIIDPHTGTDQTSSQWDGALHQFLQLKEGCKLTLQSLKAVFISNATYIKRYKMLLGASGTLGSKAEQEFLQENTIANVFLFRLLFRNVSPSKLPKC
jgi:preprotein translocase subunit SecA